MINVLSCFDGLSGGQLALEKAGIKVNKYFASEIDKYAIAVAKYNYPNTIHLGDIKKIDTSTLPKIDLMLAGSPCTDLSFAGKQKGLFDGEQSSLFFVWWKLVQEIKPKYIFLENVRMKKEYEKVISDLLGFEPVAIDSALKSAQKRYRLYWFGVREGDTYKAVPIQQPKDEGLVLKDIIEDGFVDKDKSYCIDANYWKGGNLKMYFEKSRRQLVFNQCIQVGETADIKGYDIIKRVYSVEGKAPSLTTMQGGHREPKIAVDKLTWRKLTPLECERLQTVPDGYTQYGDFGGEQFDKDGNFIRYTTKPVSNSQRYKMLGNGWTINVITHILEGMKDV